MVYFKKKKTKRRVCEQKLNWVEVELGGSGTWVEVGVEVEAEVDVEGLWNLI